MFVEERQESIVLLLNKFGKVKVKELSEKFAVTEDCIRKDLASLEKEGYLKRAYGGAVIVRTNVHKAEVRSRKKIDVSAKKAIAQKALTLIKNQDMVFLDISTSNLELAHLLAESTKEITVVTNMVEILVLLAKKTEIKIVFVGGVINKSRDGFWGSMTMELIAKCKPDIAFVGAVGIDVFENSISTYDIEDGSNKAMIIKVSKKAYLVAEFTKFSKDGNYNYATLDDLTGVITNQALSIEVQEAMLGHGVDLL
ncbi:MAG: glcR [Massilibacillus sp.]|jgi:DeoR family glycerol-3-phosphate regulon repressor|nr:glcR [Massilibacillus sp.]